MQTINIPDDQFQRLAEVAHAAGWPDVNSLLASLAYEPTIDPRGSLTEQELKESVAVCERGEQSIQAGEGQDLRQAMLAIAERYRLTVN